MILVAKELSIITDKASNGLDILASRAEGLIDRFDVDRNGELNIQDTHASLGKGLIDRFDVDQHAERNIQDFDFFQRSSYVGAKVIAVAATTSTSPVHVQKNLGIRYDLTERLNFPVTHSAKPRFVPA